MFQVSGSGTTRVHLPLTMLVHLMVFVFFGIWRWSLFKIKHKIDVFLMHVSIISKLNATWQIDSILLFLYAGHGLHHAELLFDFPSMDRSFVHILSLLIDLLEI